MLNHSLSPLYLLPHSRYVDFILARTQNEVPNLRLLDKRILGDSQEPPIVKKFRHVLDIQIHTQLFLKSIWGENAVLQFNLPDLERFLVLAPQVKNTLWPDNLQVNLVLVMFEIWLYPDLLEVYYTFWRLLGYVILLRFVIFEDSLVEHKIPFLPLF